MYLFSANKNIQVSIIIIIITITIIIIVSSCGNLQDLSLNAGGKFPGQLTSN